MHRAFVPKFSLSHRFACFALYRALLRQCSKLPQTVPQLSEAQSHIRERFRRYRTLQSPTQIANALKAGYEGLDLLHSALQGSKNDSKLIAKILSEAASVKERKRRLQSIISEHLPVKKPSLKQIKAEENKRVQEKTARRHPDATPILSRPRLAVSGQRRIPVLVNARGVPFLRIKKPQPNNLSRVIRSKLERRWAMIERKERLQLELTYGKDEDRWDNLTIGSEPETWSDPIATSLQDVQRLIHNTDKKNTTLAESMWKIVLAERKLAEEEKQTPAKT
ncbi:LYR motif-containing protein [Aspergillus lucknowensis]|uniref:Complex 1 LYR protein domain-containing protein n=1 Tax=Aspergillus lucknowensis TaxID=176173 RepID=A0ABR4LLS5_9EURO